MCHSGGLAQRTKETRNKICLTCFLVSLPLYLFLAIFLQKQGTGAQGIFTGPGIATMSRMLEAQVELVSQSQQSVVDLLAARCRTIYCPHVSRQAKVEVEK